jgi:hypothetical protein
MPGFAQAITLADNYIYVADIYNGLRILDISKPLTPIEIGFFNKLGGASAIEIKDNYAYVNFGKCEGPYQCDTTLHVLDISNPATPVEIEGYKEWREFKIVGDYAYVLDEAKWLHIFDISNPATPKEVNILKEAVTDFALANGYLYLLPPNHFNFTGGTPPFTSKSYLKILDPISLTEITSLRLPEEYPAEKIIIAGEFAYVYWYTNLTTLSFDGWLAIDISNPTAPTLREDVYKPQYLQATTIDSHYAYFAAGIHGLRIFDITDPKNLIEVDAYGADNAAINVAVADGYIYLANGSGGLHILQYPGAE